MTVIQLIECNVDMPGEYLSRGEVFKVCRRESGRGFSATAHFRNVITDAGVNIKETEVERALRHGKLKVLKEIVLAS